MHEIYECARLNPSLPTIRLILTQVGAAADLPCLYRLRVMEARWILVLVGGRAPFSSVRVNLCWGGA